MTKKNGKNGKENKENLPIAKGINAIDTAGIEVPDKPMGTDKMEKDDLIVPRVKLLQSTSQAITEKDMKPGQFVNSITDEIYPEGMECLFFSFSKGFVEFGEDIGDPVKTYEYEKMKDNEDAKWVDGEPPKLKLSYNYPMIIINAKSISPIVLVLMKSGVKVAKQLNTRIKMANESLYDTIYKITSMQTKNSKGTFFVYKIEPLRPATPKERAVGCKYYEQFAKSNVEILMEKEDEPAVEEE